MQMLQVIKRPTIVIALCHQSILESMRLNKTADLFFKAEIFALRQKACGMCVRETERLIIWLNYA